MIRVGTSGGSNGIFATGPGGAVFVTDSTGTGLGTPTPENRKIVFRIYDAASAGNLLWTEEQTVTVGNGVFSVLLGQGIPFSTEPRPTLDTVFAGLLIDR